jgi:hypothetical protein
LSVFVCFCWPRDMKYLKIRFFQFFQLSLDDAELKIMLFWEERWALTSHGLWLDGSWGLTGGLSRGVVAGDVWGRGCVAGEIAQFKLSNVNNSRVILVSLPDIWERKEAKTKKLKQRLLYNSRKDSPNLLSDSYWSHALVKFWIMYVSSHIAICDRLLDLS